MLHFIYRDSLVEDEVIEPGSSSSSPSVIDTLTVKLLAAADVYGLGRLKRMCESHLCKDISVNTVADTLALANKHHATELKAVCLRFAAENLAGTLCPLYINLTSNYALLELVHDVFSLSCLFLLLIAVSLCDGACFSATCPISAKHVLSSWISRSPP